MSDKKPDLGAAYVLKTPEDSKRLYRDWAESYDADFARAHDYRLPQATADAFADGRGAGPVLDVGAGTGLLGAAPAKRGIGPIDGLDISEEMLEAARRKGAYRALSPADPTKPLPIARENYAGITSSGTFTHGHVGPEALDGLIAVAAPGALFALSINAGVYAARGFDAKFDTLGDMIAGLELLDVPIYGDSGAADHAGDRALPASANAEAA
ncbi:methyltransferase [Defluviimonas sp. 20V17]|uniref:Methyltransferase domain-containing protein n=1 Tax=Allgaiera indica TaxID=765699 RepID=A0AAN4UNV2_9RHOB|nr:class I SAM-dependent methyltransferase [Allgaiera indica]KDB02499.1 methyltransferase [Defluviimonas sp. 20V17]GHD98777.1 methyltransferase type 11 [Allgaiera indica]SDW06385.1 Methyltransferase domain-containing protein [Allgaiera indica]